jgi:tRNA (guanine-N7-)-methyltransferase
MNLQRHHPISPEATAIVQNRRREVSEKLAVLVRANREITLELGCGHGHFLTGYARAHPEEFCLGIDRKANRIRRSFRKQDRAGLDNLSFMRAEVGQFLGCLPEAMRLTRVFVLFPDPWPKHRHIKNRMLNLSTLTTLARYAVPGADLFIRTDDFGCLEWIASNLGGSSEWRVSPERSWPYEIETVFQRKARTYWSLSVIKEDPAKQERSLVRV